MALKHFEIDKLVIWEPCCGRKRNIVNNLVAKNLKVFYSDINANNGENWERDFLKDPTVSNDVNFIITNPPWSQNKAFFKRAIELGISFAFLVKLDVIATKYFTAIAGSQLLNITVIPINLSHPFYNEEKQCDVQVGKVCWIIGVFSNEASTNAEIKFDFTNPTHFNLNSNDTEEDDDILLSLRSLFE